jgi:hypothetical protein
LKGKPGVVAVIDELEKLRPLLKGAAACEVALAATTAGAAAEPATPPQEAEQPPVLEPRSRVPEEEDVTEDAVTRLLQLLYFSQASRSPILELVCAGRFVLQWPCGRLSGHTSAGCTGVRRTCVSDQATRVACCAERLCSL